MLEHTRANLTTGCFPKPPFCTRLGRIEIGLVDPLPFSLLTISKRLRGPIHLLN